MKSSSSRMKTTLPGKTTTRTTPSIISFNRLRKGRVLEEEETAITGPMTAATTVLADAICGDQIAGIKPQLKQRGVVTRKYE
ncbi:hypothetical protein JTB14_021795 [Gonioctena quinquepunctata]|nr:hypothetical protein JTB14_021795 [Gonioctena quinquepunctata]